MHSLRRGRRGAGFALRLILALAFALVAVGVAQYTAVERTLTGTATKSLESAHAADATVLSNLYRDPQGGMAGVAELLGHIASRPGVDGVVLLDSQGEEAVVGVAAHGGDTDHNGDAGHGPARAQADGHASAQAPDHDMGTEQDMGTEGPMAAPQPDAPSTDHAATEATSGDAVQTADHIVVSVPVDLDGRTYILKVQRDDAELQASVQALRRVMIFTLTGGLLLVLPLFYVIGGRGLVSSHQEAVEGSMTDGLTGLGNHRGFHDDLRTAVSTAGRHGRHLTIAMVDLDGFKQVNDTYGHARGDQVLAAVAAVLREGRQGDRAYRIGGDEFALVMAETDAAGAWEVAERIRARVDREVDAVTTSIGIAALGVSSPTAPSLLAAADEALYAAKAAGKNVIVTAEPRRERAVVPA